MVPKMLSAGLRQAERTTRKPPCTGLLFSRYSIVWVMPIRSGAWAPGPGNGIVIIVSNSGAGCRRMESGVVLWQVPETPWHPGINDDSGEEALSAMKGSVSGRELLSVVRNSNRPIMSGKISRTGKKSRIVWRYVFG